MQWDELVFIRGTTDTLIAYGYAVCNGHAVWWLYKERYPNRRVPHQTTFTSFSFENLITRIYVPAGKKRDMPEILQNVRNFMQHHCQAC
ncbi:hypothetical protein TNCV_2763611 [Trichonephila clavipes]|nr:hypothetical protein TNCV_2763611 [Trichonephila clavipes]